MTGDLEAEEQFRGLNHSERKPGVWAFQGNILCHGQLSTQVSSQGAQPGHALPCSTGSCQEGLITSPRYKATSPALCLHTYSGLLHPLPGPGLTRWPEPLTGEVLTCMAHLQEFSSQSWENHVSMTH